MSQSAFDFSVIVAVHNEEGLVPGTVNDLINQTVGPDRIQLILVDDGSVDASGRICDEVRRESPGNVLVLHRDHEGRAAAWNAGLSRAEGSIVTFFDPGDALDRDALEKVRGFMEAHRGEADVCRVFAREVDNPADPHQYNDMFARGTRVADLLEPEEAGCVLPHATATFYRAEAAAKLRFDGRMRAAYDAKLNLELLMERPRFGVIADAEYRFRARESRELERAQGQKDWYFADLRGFVNEATQRAERQYGCLPAFVQHALMWELRGRLLQEKLPEGILTPEEAEEYRRLLVRLAGRLDEEVLLAQGDLPLENKLFVLARRHAAAPTLRRVEAEGGAPDCELCFEGRPAARLSEMRMVWEFASVGPDGRSCVLEGRFTFPALEGFDPRPALLVNGEAVACERIDRSALDGALLGETVSSVAGFRAEVPLAGKRLRIRPAVGLRGAVVPMRNPAYGDFFPVTDLYRNACWVSRGWMLTVADGEIRLSPRPNPLALAARECRFLREIWQRNLLGGRKAVAGRLFFHVARRFKRRALWILSDRVNKADDNGEALFRYLAENPPKGVRVVFAIRRDCEDAARMAEVGKCVDAMSFRHKLLYLISDVNISTQAEAGILFSGYSDALRDLLRHQHFVFLQHGITKDDVSGWLNRYSRDISGFVTAAQPEWSSIVENPSYHYPAENIWLTGFPRYDRLYRAEEKKVTLMPTWRMYLMGSSDPATGQWSVCEDFVDSEFFRFYDALLNSDRLLRAMEARGYALQFFPHPNLQPHMGLFHRDARVEFLPANTRYRDVYARSNLVVTDYSSAVFDFAYLRKPVLYCQFDRERFFRGDHCYTQGYFDYERDGFGEVTYDLESTIDRIIDYVDRDCALKDEYRGRMDRFFAFNDRENCRRVTEKILALPKRP